MRMNKQQKKAVMARVEVARFCVRSGEPDYAITAIESTRDLALEFVPHTHQFMNWLSDAAEECEIGSLEKAMHLLDAAEI